MDKICCRFARVSPIYVKFRINLIDILLNTAFGTGAVFPQFCGYSGALSSANTKISYPFRAVR